MTGLLLAIVIGVALAFAAEHVAARAKPQTARRIRAVSDRAWQIGFVIGLILH